RIRVGRPGSRPQSRIPSPIRDRETDTDSDSGPVTASDPQCWTEDVVRGHGTERASVRRQHHGLRCYIGRSLKSPRQIYAVGQLAIEPYDHVDSDILTSHADGFVDAPAERQVAKRADGSVAIGRV